MEKNGVEMELLVHGRTCTEYYHRSEVFVEGRSGSEFQIRITNNHDRRVTVVLSMDGLSVMDGKLASANRQGYIIGANSSETFKGWRLNDEDVATFEFANKPACYAAQMGDPKNVGVIGAVAFLEKRKMVAKEAIAMRGPTARDIGVGVGFGRRQREEVTTVAFEREEYPVAQLAIRYDTAQGLERRGIKVVESHQKPDSVMAAKPFPADEPKGCVPPAGWRG